MDHAVEETGAEPARPLSRKHQIRIAAALLAVVLILFWLMPATWHWFFEGPPPPPPHHDDGTFAATDRQWATLRFETVRTQGFTDGATSDGRIAVDDDLTTPVMSPFTGKVTRIFAQVGKSVVPGTPLFAVAGSEFVQARSDLIAANGAMSAANAVYRQTLAAEARQRDLYAHNGAALKDLQQSQSDLANAQAGLRNAQAGMLAVRNRLRILGTDSDTAIRGSNGEVIVRAPVGGIVTQRQIGVGQNIGSISGGNATQAFTISDFRKVWLVGNLREEDALRAHVGQNIEVRPLIGGGPVLRARLDYVAPAIDPNSRRLTVRAEIANPDGRLKPETFVKFALLTGSERKALSVSEDAVIYEGDTARLWVAEPRHHRLALRQVKTGAATDGRVEIVGGLREGEVVVTAGSLFIDRGAKVD
ncbi:MAG TPA: efflux RND transporter periplasmic adaptor subunit [Sphingobium sp.]|uniref:efflux RND transporter periplasmic adaptor subunit n=1 Tax=Sphingobium sp. TaxID=1912891 RepID=UPI002ED31B85